MKKVLLILALLFAPLVRAQNLTTVSATVTDTVGTPYISGNLNITFVNTSGQQALFGGNSAFQQTYSAKLDSTGSFTISLPSNTVITPSGTQWAFNVCASDGASCFSSSITISGATQSVSATLSAASPRITFTVGEKNQPACGAGQILVAVGTLFGCGTAATATTATNLVGPGTVTGNYFHTGIETFANTNNVIWVDQNKYAGIGTAIAALPATGGTVMVGCPASGTYGETLSANLTFPSYTSLQFVCPAIITMGSNQVRIPAGNTSNSITSTTAFGLPLGAGATNGVTWVYSGAGAAFLIGGSGSDTSGFTFQNQNVDTTLANSSTAIAMNVIRTQRIDIEKNNFVGLGGASQSQIGVLFDGTGNFLGNGKFENNRVVQFKTGVGTTGTGSQAVNAFSIRDNEIANCGAAGGVGLDLNGSGNWIVDNDVENCNGTGSIGYRVGNSGTITTTGNFLDLREENNTTGTNIAANATNTTVFSENSIDPNVNNGTCTNFFNFTATTDILCGGITLNHSGTPTIVSPTIQGTVFGGPNLSASNLGFNGNFSATNLLASTTAPTIAAAGCGGSAASITVNNGTASFKINVGTTPGSACTITMPAATTGWNCFATDITTNSTSVFLQKQTGAESTTSVTITNFSDVAAATAFVASDILKVSCHAD